MAAIALACWLVFYLLAFALRGAIQRRRTGHSGFLRPIGRVGWIAYGVVDVGLFGAFVALALDLAGLVEPIPLLDSPQLHLVGAFAFVLGSALALTAQLTLGNEWRAGVRPGEKTRLITAGIFGRVRNPFFSGWLLALLGVTAMAPTWPLLLSLLSLGIGVELVVRLVEEPHLERVQGPAYLAYRERTGRFLPQIG